VLFRSLSHRHELLCFGEFRLAVAPLELRRNAEVVALQIKAMRLLALLASREGELVTNDDIRAALWSDRTVDFSGSTHTYVRQIRRALGDSADAPRFLKTEPRQGYRFIAPVRRVRARPKLWSQQPHLVSAHVGAAAALMIVAAVTIHSGPMNDHGPVTAIVTAQDADATGQRLLDGRGLDDGLQFAPALTAAARAHVIAGRFEDARPLVKAALAIDPNLAEAHEVSARIAALADWRWKDADEHLARAIDIDGDYAAAHQGIAMQAALRGQRTEAISHMERARDINPASAQTRAELGRLHIFFGDAASALESCQHALDMGGASMPARLCLIRALLQLEDYDQAKEHMTAAMLESGVSETEAGLRLGTDASMWRHSFYEWRLEQVYEQGASAAAQMATLHALLEDYDEAFVCLDAALDRRLPDTPFAAIDPAFDSIRSTERFKAALERMSLA